MKLIYLDEAKAELAEAIEWYSVRNPSSAARLADLIADAIEEIALTPRSYPLCELSEIQATFDECASRAIRTWLFTKSWRTRSE